jgi:hypothetical protein
MHKSVALFAAIGVAAAAVAAVFGLWLPARHQRENAAWTTAGERALTQISLPSQYSTNTVDGRIGVCSNGGIERCFLGPGDPEVQTATVKAALANVTTGTVKSSCAPVLMPGDPPPSCHLVVPVAGSRLAVDLFAHPRDRSTPISRWTYTGAYVLIHVDPR